MAGLVARRRAVLFAQLACEPGCEHLRGCLPYELCIDHGENPNEWITQP